MKKEELICEYCKAGISENDKNCPNCGADCTKIVNKYKDKEREKLDAERAKMMDMAGDVFKGVGTAFKIHSIIFVGIFILVLMVFIFIGFNIYNSNKKINSPQIDIEKKKEKENVNVTFNELAKTDEYEVILDSYELYDYSSKDFPDSYNTPDGYQKIAFNFSFTNKSGDMFITPLISLFADDYSCEKSELEACVFCQVVSGKEKYQSLEMSIFNGDKVKGYVGFLVPKSAKELKFKVGSSVTIEMDNPSYEG